MIKRLLTVGYRINNIEGLNDISFSNYSLSSANEKNWLRKLSKIEAMLQQNELQCILIVVCRNFIEEVEYLGPERFKAFLSICKKTNCFVAIQEYFLEDEPRFYDYTVDKKYTIAELEKIIKDSKNEADKNVNVKKVSLSLKGSKTTDSLVTTDVFDELEGTEPPPFFSEENRYERYLDLLLETERIFPQAKKVIKILKSEFEDSMSFRFLSQVEEYAKNEIIERFSNEILNIYIPKQYGYKFEFDDFIQLFEKYLKSIEELNISIEINETGSGINYKFISNDKVDNLRDLPNKFKRFTNFIDLCEKEPEQALKLLEDKNITPNKALEIIQRMSKKYKRLALDIKQQQERLEFEYKQEVQREIFEYGYSDTPFGLVQKSFSIKSLDDIYNPSEEEEKLIQIVQEHSDDIEVINIKSDLNIIKDSEIKLDDRKKSAFKLKKILSKIVSKGIEHAERIVVESIITYINSKIG